MPRYLFNFIGENSRTFSDSIEQWEYRTPEIIQRFKERPVPTPTIPSHDEMVEAITGEVESFRQKRYRSPEHRRWDPDSVWYVHSSISDERAIEIMDALTVR